MFLKYNIGNQVYFYNDEMEEIQLGQIVGIEPDVTNSTSFIRYVVKDLYGDANERFYATERDIMRSREEVFAFLCGHVYGYNGSDIVSGMSEEEFDKYFAEKHGIIEDFSAFCEVVNTDDT